MSDNTKAIKLLNEVIALLGGSESASVIPSSEAVSEMKASEAVKVAKSLNIQADKNNAQDLLGTLASINEGGKVSKSDVADLAEALGIDADEVDDVKAAILETAAGKSDDDDKDESEEEESEEDDSDSDESEEEEEDEKPAKKGKKSKADAEDEEESEDEESEDEESEDDEDEEDEKPAKKKGKKSDDDDEDEESEDEESEEEEESEEPADADKYIKAYNKVAKKKVKDWSALAKLLTDDDGEVAEWGVAYAKDENAWCCGMPCLDVKVKGTEVAKCQVSGNLFTLDDEGALVPFKSKK